MMRPDTILWVSRHSLCRESQSYFHWMMRPNPDRVLGYRYVVKSQSYFHWMMRPDK